MIEDDCFFFLFSSSNGSNKGIRTAPGMKKYDRFKAIQPWFSTNMIRFPEGYRDDPFILEFENEIKMVGKQILEAK